MGTFQEVLDGAIEEGDVVTIERFPDDSKGVFYIQIARKTKAFGTLRQNKQIAIDKATPGKLAEAIYKVSQGLRAAVDTITAAQASKEKGE